MLLEQGTRLFVVPDGILDGKDSNRFIAGLHIVAIGCLCLSCCQRVIGQLGGSRSLRAQQRQSALVQDLPPRLA